jgi:GH24 family phage-related lysozyme (muramidase)
MPDPILVKPNKRPVDLGKAAKVIMGHEGYVKQPYLDSKNKWTIGYGNLIGDGSLEDYKASPYYKGNIIMGRSGIAGRADLSGASIDQETARGMMVNSLDEKAKIALKEDMIGDKFFDLSPDLQSEILSSFYRGMMPDSKKTMAFIREGDFKKAQPEFLDSKDYREGATGVKKRMEKLSQLLGEETKKQSFYEAASGASRNSFMEGVEKGFKNEEIESQRSR